MRLLVFFDLPVKEKQDRKAYSRFHRFLVKDGYDMLQLSVYSRICNSPETAEMHYNRLRMNLPYKGSVRCLTITENQYARMKFLVGSPGIKEKTVKSNGVLVIQETLFE